MSLDNEIENAVQQIPECLAAGYVDLSTGMLMGVKTVDSHPDEVLETVAAATADLFQGPNVVMIEQMFKKSRGLEDDDHHYFQEMIVNSDNLIHIFMRGKQDQNHVATFVCRISANLGMALNKARKMMPTLEASV